MNRLSAIVYVLLFLCSCSNHTQPLQECYVRPVAPYEPCHNVYHTQPKAQKPLAAIAIDPGHGGKDVGALSLSKPVVYEKTLNLDASQLLKKNLQRQGFSVIMTRDDDTFVTLEGRSNKANEKNADYFISVHFNSAPAKKAHGIEVFYYESKADSKRTEQSKALAQAVLDQVISTTQAKSRGVKHGNFAVIRKTSMPAILVEGGFMTHEEEMEKLRDPVYLQKVADGISRGVEDYIKKNTNKK